MEAFKFRSCHRPAPPEQEVKARGSKILTREGNEFQCKFDAKALDYFDDYKSHLKSISEGMTMLGERQKLFLLTDKSAFGWKTVTEYLQQELVDDEQDGKKIRRA